jgi:hypothetical protein
LTPPFICRAVIETVYSIRDQVVHLRQQNRELLKMLEDEISSRKKLEAVVKNFMGGEQQKQQQVVVASDLEGTSI